MNPGNLRKDLLRIFRKYLAESASPEEKAFTEAGYDSFKNLPDILDKKSEPEIQRLESRMENRLRLLAQTQDTELKKNRWHHTWWFRVAASVSLIIAGCGTLYYFKFPSKEISKPAIVRNLQPGKDQATLTLSDGSEIQLDEANNGILARQDGTEVHKLKNGLIAYSGTNTKNGSTFNTITAPAGGKYSVLLPDGSQAWLNAESSIRFPTAFPVGERKVTISGEVYFEVTKDPKRPFEVNTPGKQEVTVLGTHFNVNAYNDENAVTTTVLEGSVEVSVPGSGKVKLKPGEQSATSGSGNIRVTESINTEEIVAWKNGMFQFEKADIRTVMRQLSRWYNVEVVYEGEVPGKAFSGKINRSVDAAEILEILSFTGVNFRIENAVDAGKRSRIVVTP